MRIETAEAGRQLRREHVDGPFREIHRGAAVEGLGIESRTVVDVVGHVGNVHAEPIVAVGQPLDRDRIIKVARVLAVDGHDRAVAEVGAAGHVLLAHGAADASGLGHRVGTVLVGNAVLAEDDLGVDAGVVDVAENFGDAAGRAARRRRPARDRDRHHLARLGAHRLVAGNLHLGGQPLVERHHERQAGVIEIEAADDAARRALEHLNDLPFGAAILAIPLNANDDAIAVQRLLQVVRGHDNIAGQALNRTLGPHEADARGMTIELADDQVHAVGHPVQLALDEDQVAIVDEVAQEPLEGDAFLAVNPQDAQQFARGGRVRYVGPHLAEEVFTVHGSRSLVNHRHWYGCAPGE